MHTKVIGADFAPILTLSEAQNFTRVEDQYDNELIENLLESATQYVEEYTHRKIRLTTVQAFIDSVSANQFVTLPYGELKNIESIIVEGTPLTQSDYKVNLIKNGLIFNNNYRDILITYKCGYIDTLSIPKPIKQAILMLAATMYENREDVIGDVGISFFKDGLTSSILLAPYRLYEV